MYYLLFVMGLNQPCISINLYLQRIPPLRSLHQCPGCILQLKTRMLLGLSIARREFGENAKNYCLFTCPCVDFPDNGREFVTYKGLHLPRPLHVTSNFIVGFIITYPILYRTFSFSDHYIVRSFFIIFTSHEWPTSRQREEINDECPWPAVYRSAFVKCSSRWWLKSLP